MMLEVSHFIGGQEVTGGDRFAPIFNPASGEEIGRVRLAAVADVDHAVIEAKKVRRSWTLTTPLRRARILARFLQILENRIDDLAQVITLQHGKTLPDAKGEIQRGIEVLEFALGAPHLLKGEVTENVGTRVDSYSIMQPLGIVAGITPFNFPVMVPMWMFPVALACGNCFILKPSERDPGPSLLLAAWLKEAGLPDGVFSVIQGDKATVEALLDHPDVSAISFVGSTPVARAIYQRANQNGKRCQALGGAKNHMIVMPDADLDLAADALIGAAYGSAGEWCMAISVAVPIGDEVADALRDKLVTRIDEIVVGPGIKANVEMGPLITAQHCQRVIDYIEGAVADGVELVRDGRRIKVPGHERGYYVGPTLLDHVTTDMRIYKEEVFGPVLALVRAPDGDSAVNWINDHEYGNGTTIFTKDGNTARSFAHDIEVGMVGINVPIPVPMAFHSFGGWKSSLFGDHHMHGPEGFRFYTKLKTITSRWTQPGGNGRDLIMPTMK
jgi:malonate-semialdehyde dehydrogenase (acetylating) / methylmalonate-semialdehyde dehydrogenase